MLQAEREGAAAQAAGAAKAAEAAEQRCEELQWRLQQRDAALAQRAKLAEEARAATEGLSKVHILSRAVSLQDVSSMTACLARLTVLAGCAS